MKIHHHIYDLPEDFIVTDTIAIDTEAMGLSYHRDRLCLVQLKTNDGDVHLVQFPDKDFSQSPRLISLLINPDITKIFHFARFDVAILQHSFNICVNSIYCTKIASRLCRTYTEKHGLKELCKALLSIDLSKEEQTSDWGAKTLTESQKKYAATDVLHLHALKAKLDALLLREDRHHIAQACFEFLPTQAELDTLCGESFNIFAHS